MRKSGERVSATAMTGGFSSVTDIGTLAAGATGKSILVVTGRGLGSGAFGLVGAGLFWGVTTLPGFCDAAAGAGFPGATGDHCHRHRAGR